MDYRKLWENAHGQIPCDEHGRTYEIHHIDGDRSNNSIDNLSCMPIEEHLYVHYHQQDWGAVAAILLRMGQNQQLLRDAASMWSRESNQKRLEAGTHNFLDALHHKKVSTRQKQLIASNQHHFQSQDNSSLGKKGAASKRRSWIESSEEDFISILKGYKFLITRKLRNGQVERCVNKLISQALHVRYDTDDRREEIFNMLKEYHNVNETCLFLREQDKDKWGRRRQYPTKRSGSSA